MCSQMDDPTQHEPPKVTRPRTLVYSGAPESLWHEGLHPNPNCPACRAVLAQSRGSVALAVLGEMLNDAENALEAGAWPLSNTVQILREARDRVAAAER